MPVKSQQHAGQFQGRSMTAAGALTQSIWNHSAGGHYSLGGTIFTREFCPGGHFPLVNNVRGDIIHGGTLFPPTPSMLIDKTLEKPLTMSSFFFSFEQRLGQEVTNVQTLTPCTSSDVSRTVILWYQSRVIQHQVGVVVHVAIDEMGIDKMGVGQMGGW